MFKKNLVPVVILLISACYMKPAYRDHLGPHRLELQDTIIVDGIPCERFRCYKNECQYTENHPIPVTDSLPH